MSLYEVIEKAKKLGHFLITITMRDENKKEDDLTHYVVRNEFPVDDILTSIDACVRTLGIEPEKPLEIIEPPKVHKDRKPLKIAIISHFNRAPESYSPARAVKNQIKVLQKYGHEVVFFVMEGSKLDWNCEMRPVVPKFKREKNVVNEEGKQKFINVLKEQLTSDFDIAITHDLYIDDCITFREAIKECGVKIPWLHWARSGVGRPIDFKMPNARYVYMNYADTAQFARNINAKDDSIRVVFNEKDPELLFGWNPITTKIVNKMRLWEKDIVQTYPLCSTRFDAKGINSVICVFGILKEMGQKVGLVICNANCRHRQEEVKKKIEFAKSWGLVEGQDILFTSTLYKEGDEVFGKIDRETPHQVVTELMRVSNLFIFPTMAEVCSNVLLEASMTKNLLVLNKDLPCLFDFADNESVLSYPFISFKSLHYEGKSKKSYERLAKDIIVQLRSNKADMQFRHVWRNHCIDSIYYNMLEPVIYER